MAEAAKVFGKRAHPARSMLSARTFVMRPNDLPAWDRLIKHGPEGYSYGVLWSEDGHIAKHAAIREVQPADVAAEPTIDLGRLEAALAIAQMQQQLAAIRDLLEQLTIDVRAVARFLHLEQEAEVLAAVETVAEVHEHLSATCSVGSVNWDRVSGLEQLLKKQHRQIIGELLDVAVTLAFRDVVSAKSARALDEERIRHLLFLEHHLLESLTQWSQIMLKAKLERSEWTPAATSAAFEAVEDYSLDYRQAVTALLQADSTMCGRGILEMLFTDGLVVGSKKDGDLEQAALAKRREVQQTVREVEISALLTSPVLELSSAAQRLELEGPTAESA